MPLWLTKTRTAIALGIPNLVRVAWYRVAVRAGVHPVRRLEGDIPAGPFFAPSQSPALPLDVVSNWNSSARLFSYWPIALKEDAPDWLANPLTGKSIPMPKRPWWTIADFDPEVGDIKLIWELSRMDWVLALAQKVRQRDRESLDRLNAWIANWSANNTAFYGPNWKCGQEASIRVLHLACAALLLDQTHDALPGLIGLVAVHLQRIAPTVQYAKAQDNNHGTSEAAALFIGGNWLELLGDARGPKWASLGRNFLENRVSRLIGAHGTFSQYSLNYHRVMLDTLCLAEVWRRRLNLPAFSTGYQVKTLAASRWLNALVDPDSGDGPNVGANDGARLLQLCDLPYRDYRPTVQMAMVLFAGQCAYANDGPWNAGLNWLGVNIPAEVAPSPSNLLADDGGFMVLRRGGAMALLRYPRFTFRPSQADVLHLDLWCGGKALLRDAGTYSYNTEAHWINYFGGVAGHNTVQFDGRDQMPRLSRFLLGNWLKVKRLDSIEVSAECTTGGAGYRDSFGAQHHRRVELMDGLLRVTDQVQGFGRSAVLRWRLAPADWQFVAEPERVGVTRRSLRNAQGHTVIVTVNVPLKRCDLVQGWESLHYLEKTRLPVLELEVDQSATLISEYHWTT